MFMMTALTHNLVEVPDSTAVLDSQNSQHLDELNVMLQSHWTSPIYAQLFFQQLETAATSENISDSQPPT